MDRLRRVRVLDVISSTLDVSGNHAMKNYHPIELLALSMYGYTNRKSMDQQDKVANSACSQLKTGIMNISLFSCAPEKLVSRGRFGSLVPR